MIYRYCTFSDYVATPDRCWQALHSGLERSAYLLVILAALTLFSGCSTVKSAKLLVPESFGLTAIAPNIYVEESMSVSQRASLLKAIDSARKRVHLYYGSVLSTPEFVACATENCFRSLGGVSSRAKAYGESKILLSPRGQTVPIIAHEWSHAELYSKVGGFFGILSIPRWFDEGLAVVVSNEPSHSESVWLELQQQSIPCPDIASLQSRNDWMGATRQHGDASFNKEGYKIVYSCVGHELRRWYRNAGRSGLAHFIETIRYNKPFTEAYLEAEGTYLSSKR